MLVRISLYILKNVIEDVVTTQFLCFTKDDMRY